MGVKVGFAVKGSNSEKSVGERVEVGRVREMMVEILPEAEAG